MTHFSLSSLRLSGAEATGRTGSPQPVLARRLGLLSLVFPLGWIPLWSQRCSHLPPNFRPGCDHANRPAVEPKPYAALELLNFQIYDRQSP
jgi:hypothetical protein